MVKQNPLFNTHEAAKVVSYPFGVPLAREFAQNLLQAYQRNPLDLANVTIWVPSRRAALALEDALMALKPNGLVLPQIKPLHLTQEDGELLAFELAHVANTHQVPVGEHARLLYLARQVLMWQKATGGSNTASIAHAHESAASLAALSDRLRTQNVSFQALTQAVPPDMAHHWELNLQFLKIVFEYYPPWLEEQDAQDPADARKHLLQAQAQAYRQTPPENPVYLVGFTDTTPAGVALMQAVLASPQGQLVLQGFEPDLAGQTLPPTHPHYGLNRLLKALDISSETVTIPQEPSPQGELLIHSQAPAGMTHLWREKTLPPTCAEGVTLVEAPTPREEADTIAIIMRRTLETPEKTCALVTTDRQLAARVADQLQHWHITVNDSAGTPLPTSPAGSFFLLLSQTVATGFKPQIVAQLLAHPLATGGMTKKDWKAATRTFEANVLRGVTPDFGLVGLRQKVAEVTPQLEETAPHKAQQVAQIMAHLDDLTAPLRARKKLGLAAWVQAHIKVGKAFAMNDVGENGDIFLQQEDGDVLFQQLEALMGAESHADTMTLADYHTWLEAFLQQATVRDVYTQHPRLFIWGPLEARMQQADVVILGGMNEGVWPNLPQPDPWLNRSMAANLGLPPREMAIGLNAHDFCALASASNVVLTRTLQQEGTPTVPSRYLLRLKAVLQIQPDTLKAMEQRGQAWLTLAQQWAVATTTENMPRLTGAQAAISKQDYPARWSASAVGTFMQCPYRFYGEKVLKVQPFEPFDQAPDAADKGDLIHRCFEAFLTQKDGLPSPWQTPLAPDTLKQATAHLMTIAEEVFQTLKNNASRKVWLSRFQVAAEAFVETLTAQQQADRTPWLLEQKGELTVGSLRLHARADRIDTTPHGTVVVDYKTGHIPTKKSVTQGLAPQLTLEGLMLAEGGFDKTASPVANMEYWKVGQGSEPFSRALNFKEKELTPALEATKAGLEALEETFLTKQTPLHALPEKDACRLCDFAGLCRRHEWQHDVKQEAAE